MQATMNFYFVSVSLCPLLEKDVLVNLHGPALLVFRDFRESYNVISSSGHTSTLGPQRPTKYMAPPIATYVWGSATGQHKKKNAF